MSTTLSETSSVGARSRLSKMSSINSEKHISIADAYFFDELSRALGVTAAQDWLCSLQRVTSDTQQSVTSRATHSSSAPVSPGAQQSVVRSFAPFSQGGSPMQNKSRPTLNLPVEPESGSKRRDSDGPLLACTPSRAGLLYTDAAHSVLSAQ
eukprot:CAMPEP_0184321840 /NCGR_PEP_ID=MMETSP1049-20130417/121385_1 /TAXON_ID=77928 /ORGANISM="Proteomonas sulcata, Strain CCMP704" /LENGTH=151 /DNA_ID=CAMNT_0026642801 /DNA_START=37 /DNA_END=492 /DNA_ORIENTATION=-